MAEDVRNSFEVRDSVIVAKDVEALAKKLKTSVVAIEAATTRLTQENPTDFSKDVEVNTILNLAEDVNKLREVLDIPPIKEAPIAGNVAEKTSGGGLFQQAMKALRDHKGMLEKTSK